MSEEKPTQEGKNIKELADDIQAKVVRMKESEGAEIEISELDLDDVSAGYAIYFTKPA
jgi:N12 class adenine-specific DNA methylase